VENEGGSWIRQVSFETLGIAVSAVMCAVRVDESLRKLDIADGAPIGIEPVSRSMRSCDIVVPGCAIFKEEKDWFPLH